MGATPDDEQVDRDGDREPHEGDQPDPPRHIHVTTSADTGAGIRPASVDRGSAEQRTLSSAEVSSTVRPKPDSQRHRVQCEPDRADDTAVREYSPPCSTSFS